VTNTVNKLNTAFGTMQRAGAAMAGVGGAITGLCMKTVTATFDTQNALFLEVTRELLLMQMMDIILLLHFRI